MHARIGQLISAPGPPAIHLSKSRGITGPCRDNERPGRFFTGGTAASYSADVPASRSYRVYSSNPTAARDVSVRER